MFPFGQFYFSSVLNCLKNARIQIRFTQTIKQNLEINKHNFKGFWLHVFFRAFRNVLQCVYLRVIDR